MPDSKIWNTTNTADGIKDYITWTHDYLIHTQSTAGVLLTTGQPTIANIKSAAISFWFKLKMPYSNVYPFYLNNDGWGSDYGAVLYKSAEETVYFCINIQKTNQITNANGHKMSPNLCIKAARTSPNLTVGLFITSAANGSKSIELKVDGTSSTTGPQYNVRPETWYNVQACIDKNDFSKSIFRINGVAFSISDFTTSSVSLDNSIYPDGTPNILHCIHDVSAYQNENTGYIDTAEDVGETREMNFCLAEYHSYVSSANEGDVLLAMLDELYDHNTGRALRAKTYKNKWNVIYSGEAGTRSNTGSWGGTITNTVTSMQVFNNAWEDGLSGSNLPPSPVPPADPVAAININNKNNRIYYKNGEPRAYPGEFVTYNLKTVNEGIEIGWPNQIDKQYVGFNMCGLTHVPYYQLDMRGQGVNIPNDLFQTSRNFNTTEELTFVLMFSVGPRYVKNQSSAHTRQFSIELYNQKTYATTGDIFKRNGGIIWGVDYLGNIDNFSCIAEYTRTLTTPATYTYTDGNTYHKLPISSIKGALDVNKNYFIIANYSWKDRDGFAEENWGSNLTYLNINKRAHPSSVSTENNPELLSTETALYEEGKTNILFKFGQNDANICYATNSPILKTSHYYIEGEGTASDEHGFKLYYAAVLLRDEMLHIRKNLKLNNAALVDLFYMGNTKQVIYDPSSVFRTLGVQPNIELAPGRIGFGKHCNTSTKKETGYPDNKAATPGNYDFCNFTVTRKAPFIVGEYD